MSRLEDALKRMLSVEPADVNLNWIFSHITNYGVAAGVLVASSYLLAHGSKVFPIPCVGSIIALLLLATGILLLVFNISQPIYLMAKQKIHMAVYMAVSVVIFLAAIELVWAAAHNINV